MSAKQLTIIVVAILIGTTLGASIIAFGPDYLEYRAQQELDERTICSDYRIDYRRFTRHLYDKDPNTELAAKQALRDIEEDRQLAGCTHASRYVE